MKPVELYTTEYRLTHCVRKWEYFTTFSWWRCAAGWLLHIGGTDWFQGAC